jgi:hypothetical protein
VSDRRCREPGVVRANWSSGGREICRQPRVRACCRQVDLENGEPLDDGFHERRAPCFQCGVVCAMHTMKEFARCHNGQKKLVLSPSELAADGKVSTLVLDQDAGIDQEAHASLSGRAASSARALSRSAAKAAASSSVRRGSDASNSGRSLARLPVGTGRNSATARLPRINTKRSPRKATRLMYWAKLRATSVTDSACPMRSSLQECEIRLSDMISFVQWPSTVIVAVLDIC